MTNQNAPYDLLARVETALDHWLVDIENVSLHASITDLLADVRQAKDSSAEEHAASTSPGDADAVTRAAGADANQSTRFLWLVELLPEPGGRTIPTPLYLRNGSTQQIAQRVIDADDAGQIGVGTAWTTNPYQAVAYGEKKDAEQTAKALDRCCGGYAKAVEHGFIGDRNDS